TASRTSPSPREPSAAERRRTGRAALFPPPLPLRPMTGDRPGRPTDERPGCHGSAAVACRGTPPRRRRSARDELTGGWIMLARLLPPALLVGAATGLAVAQTTPPAQTGEITD